MHEFESDWTSLSQSFMENGWIQDGRIQDGRIKDGCHHSVNQIELVWVRFRVEEECFWVNLREDNKVSKSKMAVSESKMAEFIMAAIIKLSQNGQVNFFLCKMAESKMAEFKMAAIINFSENAWVKFFCANGWIQDGRIQDGCHHQVESEWMSLIQIELDWVRVLCNKTESKMAEFKMVAII